MFISRLSYESLVRENARLQASCDWLAAHVTQLQQERAALLERVLEVQIPVMSIAREPEERPMTRQPEITPEMLSKLTPAFAPPPDAARGTVFKPPVAEEEAAAAMAIFEDAGDERADRMGAAWGPDGELVYTR